MNIFRFKSNKLLPSVLIRILPITVIVLLTIGYFSNQVINKTILDTHDSRLEQVAVQSSTVISVRLQNIMDTASDLAANDLIINSLVDAGDRERYIPTLFRSIRVLGSASAKVSLTDYRGRQVASNTVGLNYSDAPWVDEVMDANNFVSITPKGMVVAVPILISNLPEGIIVIEYGESELKSLLDLPIRADAYAIETHAGDVIFSSNEEFIRDTIVNQTHTLSDDWSAVHSGIKGFDELELFIGDKITTILAPVEQQKIFLSLAFIASVLAVTAGIIATGLMARKPILNFIEGVKRVGTSTNLAYRMPSGKIDEFQKLTASFNVMLSNLESTTSSHEYVDSILNSMNEFMLVVSSEGIVKSGNLAISHFLLCDVKELTDIDIKELISSDWQELIYLANSDTPSIETNLTNRGGRQIPVRVSASHLNEVQKDTKSFILVLEDITEQNEARATLDRHVIELSRSNDDLEQFAYVASHDLKAPLRAIDNLAQWIEEDTAEHMSEESRKDMTSLRGRIKRLDALLAGLLQYAKTGKGKTEVTLLDTHTLVQDVVDLLGAPPSIQIDVSQSLPEITTNRVPLEQVFQNLINNAIKHHDNDDGRIEIRGRDLGEFIEFIVEDDGPGISQEYHEKVFQMFQTLKRRDEVDSSGLGLAVVKKLVDAYGGDIHIDSTADKRGATFRFTWPKQKIQKVINHEKN